MELHQIERLSYDEAADRLIDLIAQLSRLDADTSAYQPRWDQEWELALVYSRVMEVTNAPEH